MFRRGNKLLLFGNGGSAMDASHMAAEFVGRYRRDRHALAAIALTTDQAKLTCIANDYDFSEIFARQVSALGRPGDVAIGISTSGNSPNVLKALETARDIGMITIGWTGGREANYCSGGTSLCGPSTVRRAHPNSYHARSSPVRIMDEA